MAVTPPTIIGPVSSGRNPDPSGFITLTIPHTVPVGTEALVVIMGNGCFLAIAQ